MITVSLLKSLSPVAGFFEGEVGGIGQGRIVFLKSPAICLFFGYNIFTSLIKYYFLCYQAIFFEMCMLLQN